MTARLLAVMGSGETAPTMVKVHRSVVAATGSEPPGLLLDTPFGFQLNADDLAARTVAYFEQSVGVPLAVAGARSAGDLAGRAGDALAARMAAAPFVFSGPGSPTYALRHWRGTLVPGLLREKLQAGGAIVFASAAALTLGAFTVPVYEIYKVGEPPRWEEGLDLLRTVDPRLRVALIPHFDNAEGGSHDTRFCYLGEPRLARLEAELPADAFVLGVDEHTALVLDLEAARLTVAGLGVVTVRVDGRSATLPTGTEATLDELLALPGELRRRRVAVDGPGHGGGGGGGGMPPGDGAPEATAARGTDGLAMVQPAAVAGAGAGAEAGAVAGAVAGAGTGQLSPLLRAARHHQAAFARARATGDAPGMIDAVLTLEAELWEWRTDPTQSDEQDRARAVLRAMVAELGDVARTGTGDPAELVGPYVELALGLRADARADRRFADADTVRDRLTALGVEVRDTPDGTTWVLQGSAGGSGGRNC